MQLKMQSRQQLSAQPKLQSSRLSWIGFAQKSSCLPSDLRASHDVCGGGLLGTGSPKGNFGAKIPCLSQFL